MRIDTTSLAFGYQVLAGGATPNWATSLGQGKEHKINIDSSIDELLRGMVYCSVSLEKISTKIGKGGKLVSGAEKDSPILIGSVFSRIYVNDVFIPNSKFILIVTRDTSDSHAGRLRLKYGPSNTYKDGFNTYSNSDFYNQVKNRLSIVDAACWFVSDISILNQNELHLSAVVVNPNGPETYQTGADLHAAWDKLISSPDYGTHLGGNDEGLSVEAAWYVGATGYNDNDEYTDFSEQYIAEHRWENRYDQKYTEIVKTMQVGDRIVIKASYTKKNNLPFDNHGKVISVMAIKAIGTITKNYGDGKNIDVDWEKVEPIKEWFGDGVLRTTAHYVESSDSYIKKALLSFTFDNVPQDFSIYDDNNDELYNDEFDEEPNTFTLPHIELNFTTNIDCDFERNRIVFGAPGTGKSYQMEEDRKKLIEIGGGYERVTFHPDYTYSNFVGCYKPVSNQGQIEYKYVPGPFMRVLVDALRSGLHDEIAKPHLLVIEEINRAKVAAVFGEVFQLLDRDENGTSDYEIHTSEDVKKYLSDELGGSVDSFDKIRIPNNMFIWATMNSADQGVYPMDTAFKRRWSFEYKGIDENEDKVGGNIVLGKGEHSQQVNWNTLRKTINEVLAKKFNINEDKLLGPFFIDEKVFAFDENGDIKNPAKFIQVFKSKVIMYLYEDAAKQHKHKLFSGCDSTKYSSICNAFDDIGIEIFLTDFKEMYDDMR